MILLVDNRDSFTYNLVQYLEFLGEEVWVVRREHLDLAEVQRRSPDYIVISPGPGKPEKGDLCMQLIEQMVGRCPILGVCLGHQYLAAFWGGKIIQAEAIIHGKTSMISHNGTGLFQDLPFSFRVTRYHSLLVDPVTLPDELEVTALSYEGEIMGLRHRTHPVFGLQFHPESVASEHGLEVLRQFLAQRRKAALLGR